VIAGDLFPECCPAIAYLIAQISRYERLYCSRPLSAKVYPGKFGLSRKK